MHYLDYIQNAYSDHNPGLHIECSFETFEAIVASFRDAYPDTLVAIHYRNDALYEKMRVKEYLMMFHSIFATSLSIDTIASKCNIESILNHKISKLSDSEKMRVALAREMLKDSPIHLFEQPLFGSSDEDSKLIISIIEELVDEGKFVLTTSPSFREVCLMPGNTFYFKEDALIPISESIDSEFISNVQSPVLDKLQVKVNGRLILIPISDILFAESIDSVTNLYVKNSYVPTGFTLDELEQKISKLGFFRTHRSYLVNTQKIKEVEQWTKNSYVINLDGVEAIKIPLSKRRYRDFQENL